MSDSKKKRMSMLDTLANAGAPAPQPMMSTNRPLRAARDAVDSHKVWEVDPDDIIDTRIADRLDLADIHDLRSSIETTGQTVPILLRRHPKEPEKYLLVYGRRRLEAIRTSDKITKVRALLAQLDDDKAVEAQISENMARRDLTYIEKALFAQELVDGGFGNQNRVAEVLTTTKSAISMALGIVGVLGADLIRAIGPAEGIGRPRWEALSKALDGRDDWLEDLTVQAERVRMRENINTEPGPDGVLRDPSVVAFESVYETVVTKAPAPAKPKPPARATKATPLRGPVAGSVRRSDTGVRLDIAQGAFADWFADQAQDLISELHDRWENRHEGQ